MFYVLQNLDTTETDFHVGPNISLLRGKKKCVWKNATKNACSLPVARIRPKAQLTRAACERLFCSLTDARIGVSCCRSRRKVAVGCTPKWTATCSRLGRQDSDHHNYQMTTGSCRPPAAERTQLQRRVLVLCELIPTAGWRFFYG